MAKPNGRPKVITGFGSEHEANAWIVQAERMIRAAGPWTPLAPRKPTTAGEQAAPVSSLASMEQDHVHDARDEMATRRSHARAPRERSVAKR